MEKQTSTSEDTQRFAAMIKRFKELSAGRYPLTYQCGHIVLMKRRVTMSEWHARGKCSTPVWLRLEDDMRIVTLSPDRPVDDATFDPHADYSYVQYRRQ